MNATETAHTICGMQPAPDEIAARVSLWICRKNHAGVEEEMAAIYNETLR